jgi:hypothetical protein
MSEGTPIGVWARGDLRPSPNGSRLKRRRSRFAVAGGVALGTLLGALLATAIVPRLHLRNLAVYNPWPRPVVAAVAGGLLVGAARVHARRWAAPLGGAMAGVAALWLVYALMRSAQGRVLYVGTSFAHVFLADLARLAAYGAPAGALGGGVGARLRELRGRRRAPAG